MSLRVAEGIELAVGRTGGNFLEGGKGEGYGRREGGAAAGFDMPEGPVAVVWLVHKLDGGTV